MWLGRAFSIIGTQMGFITINWHVARLLSGREVIWLGRVIDAQALGLGALGLVRVLPVLLLAMVGGALADSVDRRKLLITTQSVAALVAITLASLTLTNHITLPLIYLLAGLAAATFALDEPSRQAIIPHLVQKKDLTSAISLNTTVWYLGSVLGPGLGGVLIATLGNLGFIYAIDALSFGAVVLSLLLMRHRSGKLRPFRLNRAEIMEGIHFTYHNKLIWSTMLIDFWATFFGSARTMLPLVADRILHVGEQGYGWLAAAQSLGAVMAGIFLSWRGQIRRQGAILLLSVALYGAATALFGLSTVYALSFLFFALTGAGDTVSSIIRGTIRQLRTPDRLRGRMTGVNMAFFMGGPYLGEAEAGIAAALFGVPFAIVSGGIATLCMVGYMAWRYPTLRQYDKSDT